MLQLGIFFLVVGSAGAQSLVRQVEIAPDGSVAQRRSTGQRTARRTGQHLQQHAKVEQHAEQHAEWGHRDPSSPESVQHRTEVYSALTKALAFFWENDVRAFPRNGLLLGIMRSKGFMPFDRDPDLAILDVDKSKFDNLASWQENVAGWPNADVVVWRTTATHVHTHANSGLSTNASQAFPLEDFTNLVSVPFYCSEVKVPRGSEHYLDAMYGAGWKTSMINKCNDPEGELFKQEAVRCTWGCYEGAIGEPYKSAPSRGNISTAVCANGR